MIKKILIKYFSTLAYFYRNIGYRVVVIFSLSVLMGVLDGFGLAMFLPLLKFSTSSTAQENADLGKMNFFVDAVQNMGISITLMTVLGFIAFFFTAKGLVKYLGNVYKVKVLQWFIKKTRKKLLKRLNKLSYNYFVKTDVGRIQNTMTGEVTRLVRAFTSYFQTLQSLILVLVYMGFAFAFDWKFAILVSIGGVLTNFLFKRIYKETKGASKKLSGGNTVFQSLIIQQVGNYKYLKATGTLKLYAKKLDQIINYIEKTQFKMGKLNSVMASAREPILMLVILTVIYIQTNILGSALSSIIISLLFFYRALTYVMQMQTSYNQFLSMSGSLAFVQDFEKELDKNQEKRGEDDFDEKIKLIEINQGSFNYGEHKVLSDIDLTIEKNQSIAFVGESGSGKTTLINVLVGLLPLKTGDYYLNGKDIETLNIENFQNKVGYITQDPVIFNDTIFNNVTFWDTPTPENIQRFENALKQASIYDYVTEQTEGRNQILGNNGINLSGGQRQRISIARELYKDIELLVLDEATSALDSETEKSIQQNIDALKGQYTILMIAHRISTIKNADQIVVMNRGKIKAKGNYNELLKNSKYFKRLVEFQDL